MNKIKAPDWYIKLKNRLNLGKKLPKGYINKPLLNGVFLTLFIFAFFLWWGNDFQINNYSISCDKAVCENPLYLEFDHPLVKQHPTLGTRPTLNSGEKFGKETGWLFDNFNWISILIVAMAFWINHIIYIRGKNERN